MGDKHLDVLVNSPSASDRYDRPWRGRVSRTSGTSAWVVIAGIAPTHEFGPCDTRGIEVDDNDSVMVVFMGGDARDPVIVRRLQTPIPVPPAEDHGDLVGLGDDDHTQYSLADGTRAFTGTVAGVTPVDGPDLATKDYVDTGDDVETIDPFLLMGS